MPSSHDLDEHRESAAGAPECEWRGRRWRYGRGERLERADLAVRDALRRGAQIERLGKRRTTVRDEQRMLIMAPRAHDIVRPQKPCELGEHVRACAAGQQSRLVELDVERRVRRQLSGRRHDPLERLARVRSMRDPVDELVVSRLAARVRPRVCFADDADDIAESIRDGKLGILDYYKLRNVQADTEMRMAIAGAGTGPARNGQKAQS